LALFQRLPAAYVEMLNNTPEPLRGLLKDVSTALMRWKGFPDEEIDEVVDHIERREVHRMFEKLERGIKAEQAALQAERAQWHNERTQWQSQQAQWQQEKSQLLRQIEALKAAQAKKPQE
jgi:glycerol-3-phosphate dehydrogenase